MSTMGTMRLVSGFEDPPPKSWSAKTVEEGKIGFICVDVPDQPAGSACRSRAPLLKGMGSGRMDPHVGPLRRVSTGGTAGETRHGGQRTEFDSRREMGQEVKVEAQVGGGGEHRRRELPRPREMVEEGARDPPAGRAAALGVEWALVLFIAGVLDLDHPLAGEEDAV